MMGLDGMVRGGWTFTIAIGSMLMTSTLDGMSPIRTAALTITIGQTLDTMDISWAVGMVQVPRLHLPGDLTPGCMRLSPVVSVTLSAQLCLTLRST